MLRWRPCPVARVSSMALEKQLSQRHARARFGWAATCTHHCLGHMVSELNHTVLSSGVFLGHSFAYDRLAVPVECWRERNPLNIAVQLSTYSFSMNLTCCFWKFSLAPTSLFTGVVAPFHETLSLLMTAFAFCFLLKRVCLSLCICLLNVQLPLLWCNAW